MSEFKKSDLKSGMKVVREDCCYIILKNCVNNFSDCGDYEFVAINPEKGSYNWSSDIEYVLDRAKEVLEPNHPYDIFYNHNGWTSIWKKEPEKTEQQLKLEELEATIRKAQQEIQQLKEMK